MALVKNRVTSINWKQFKHPAIGQISWAATATQKKLETCYDTLNVKSDEEMEDAYFRLAKEYHPDNTSTMADTIKFTQIEESYRYLLTNRKSKLEQQENEYTMEEHQQFYDIRHTAPHVQHRQYLSNEGYGHGTPSQRDSQYQGSRAAKASEEVLSEREETLTRLRTTRSTIDGLVDDYISAAMRRGDFDNLAGSGKPLNRDFINPMVDDFTGHLNRILANCGSAPQWISLDKYIRDEMVIARRRLWTFRLKLGPEPWPDYSKGLWKNYSQDFTAFVKDDINKKVDRFNLLVPALHLQTVHYNPEREIEKVMQKYRELRAKGELHRHEFAPETEKEQVQQTSLDQPPVENDYYILLREIWKGIKALFTRSNT